MEAKSSEIATEKSNEETAIDGKFYLLFLKIMYCNKIILLEIGHSLINISSGQIALWCILKVESASWLVCLNSCDPNNILEISRWNSELI